MKRRLIDLDEIVEYLKSNVDIWKHPEALEWAIIKIKNSEVIDAEPVRHGKWIVKGGHFPYCSECETLALQKEDSGGWRHYHKSKHCPNCGAVMDLETE